MSTYMKKEEPARAFEVSPHVPKVGKANKLPVKRAPKFSLETIKEQPGF